MSDRQTMMPVIESLFRGQRRSWRGLGGGGNPKETWNDLKMSTALCFLLDRDSIFTVSVWLASRTAQELTDLVDACTSAIDAARSLTLQPEAVEDLSSLKAASDALNRAVINMRMGGVSGSISDRDAALREIDSFVVDQLIPTVDTNTSLAPSAARKIIRDSWAEILERLDVLDTLVANQDDLVGDFAFKLPHPMGPDLVEKIRSQVSDMLLRLARQDPGERTSQVQDDIQQLSGCASLLGVLNTDPVPVSIRGTYVVDAAGTGSGAARTTARSAPYGLREGISDRLNVSIDGGAAVEIVLPSNPGSILGDTVQIDLKALNVGVPETYNVQAADWIEFYTDGRAGTRVTFGAPASFGPLVFWAAVALAVPSIGGVPVLSGSVVLIGSYNFLRIQYDDTVGPVPSAGTYIEMRGNVRLMEELGFPGHDDGDPTQNSVRVFWPLVEQPKLVEHIQRNLPGSLVTWSNDILFSGEVEIDPLTPNVVLASHYWGTGEWDPDGKRLYLSGDELRRVRKGQYVFIDTAGVYGTVSNRRTDGVDVGVISGTRASGTYSVSIVDPSSFTAGAIVHFTDYGIAADYRIVGYALLPSGRVRVSLERRTYHGTDPVPGAARMVRCNILRGRIVIGSASKTPAASVQVLPASTDDAAAELGLAYGTTTSMVLHVEDATADFEADGVVSGDVVDISAMTFEVEEVLSSTRVMLDSEVSGLTTAAPCMIYNSKSYRYDILRSILPWWSTIPDRDVIDREVREILRVSGSVGASNRVISYLTTLRALAGLFAVYCKVYKSLGSLSPFLVELRESLEEAGADLAVEMLVTGRVNDLLSASTDDVSSNRTLLRALRRFSIETVGTSVFARPDEEEQAIMQTQETISVDVTPMGVKPIGPPPVNRR